MAGVPEEVHVLGGYPHVGRICRSCKGVYYEQLSDKKIEVSELVGAAGQKLVVES